MATIDYLGDGTYGSNNPTSITFPFKPAIIYILSGFMPKEGTQLPSGYWVLPFLMEKSNTYYYNGRVYIKKSASEETFSWYSSNSANYQGNVNLINYRVFAIGGFNKNILSKGTEWIITSNSSWTVPYSGNYNIELYGGRRSFAIGSQYNSQWDSWEYNIITGGASCQLYESIYLTANDIIPITIGVGSNSSSVATRTSFGSYSVNGGGNGIANSYSSYTVGSGAGNKGKDGISYTTVQTRYVPVTYSSGTLSTLYGYSAGNHDFSQSTISNARNGAVYIKYIQ